MKRLIFLMAMLLASTAYAETSKYGSMWKQNDSTVSPADDVVYVDFTGYTTIGVGDGGADFSNITSQMNITFDAIENMSIDAATTSHTDTDGVIDIMLTPSTPSTRGTQVTIDTNGQNDTMAHNVTYTANGMEAGDVGMAMEINVNPGTSNGGEVEGLRITRTGIGGVDVNAIHAGTRVAPIHQSSGAPENMDIAFLNNSGAFINATTAFQNDSSTLNYTLVPNVNDYIYIGHTTIFSDVELILETNADVSISPIFEYYTGGWTIFGPNDSTAGLTTDGVWSWESLANWIVTTVNGVTNKYWIRVQRTSVVNTDAVEKTINIIIPTEYSWGDTGDLTAYDIMMQGSFSAGPVLDVSGAGTRAFFYPKKGAWRAGTVIDTEWDDVNIGSYSHAEGYRNIASGISAHAEGRQTTASGDYAHAEGNGTIASNSFAHAEGRSTEASADAAHAEGKDTLASNLYAHAEGLSTIASGQQSHAEGSGTLASNTQSHAEGNLTIASGNASHAEGSSTTASGARSHAGGTSAVADAIDSFVHGESIRISSSGVNSVMFGSYADNTERDANQLTIPDTMKLANMNLIVDDGIVFSGQTTVMGNYSAALTDYTIFANATTAPFTIVIDATLAKGHHVRIKKTDPTANDITLDGLGAQTIDGASTFIIRKGSIMVVSDGTNWEKVQATPEAFYADMHVHDNISSTVIDTQDSPHFVRKFSLEYGFGLTFTEGSTGPISAFTEYSTVVPGTTQVTDTDHTLTTGDIVTINGTTSYNGIFAITVIDSANYYIVDTFVADDATGNWVEGDYLKTDPGTSGVYMLGFHGYGMPDAGTNQDYEFEIFTNTAPAENLEAKRRFANSSDIGTFGGGGIVTLADGDRIAIAIIPLTGTQDFTLEHLNIALHRIR